MESEQRIETHLVPLLIFLIFEGLRSLLSLEALTELVELGRLLLSCQRSNLICGLGKVRVLAMISTC